MKQQKNKSREFEKTKDLLCGFMENCNKEDLTKKKLMNQIKYYKAITLAFGNNDDNFDSEVIVLHDGTNGYFYELSSKREVNYLIKSLVKIRSRLMV